MKNFEEKLSRLEELTSAIRQSDVQLEDAIKYFEEGIKLAKDMDRELNSIESRIQILLNSPSEDSDEEAENAEPKPRKSRAKKTAEPKEEPLLELFNGSSELNGTRNA